jgi:hypothetical protein
MLLEIWVERFISSKRQWNRTVLLGRPARLPFWKRGPCAMRVGWKLKVSSRRKELHCSDTPETLVSRWNLTKKRASNLRVKAGLEQGRPAG